MRSWMIAFCLGVLGAAWLAELPSMPALAGAALILPILLRSPRLRLPGAFLLGMWWLAWQGRETFDDWWPLTSAPEELWVEGLVWSVPIPTDQGQRFRFKLERLCHASNRLSCDESAWHSDDRLVQLSSYEPLPLTPGQRWRWQVRLRRPHGFSNPGAYDYEAWLLQQRVAALGYVRNTKSAELLAHNSGRFVEGLRHRLLQALEEVGGEFAQLPLVMALSVGEGSRIPVQDWELFNRTGTSHLMVISGSHITLVAGLCLWLARRLWCLSSRLPLLWPAPFAASSLALLGAWFYTALAGFNLPAQRALAMSALTFGAVLLRRQHSLWQVLLTALVLILVLDPLAPQLPGFWLSFVAVAVLTLALLREDKGSGWWRWLWQLVRSQGYVSIALLPLTALLFQQVSWSAPLVNLIAIPLIGFIAVPLSLLSLLLAAMAPTWAHPVLWLTDAALGHYMDGLRSFDAALPTPLLTLPRLLPIGQCLLILLSVTLLLSRRFWQRIAWLACLPAILLLREEAALPHGLVRIDILDVGQGNAVLVSTSHHHLLYDTGPRYSERFEAGSASVLPVLRHHGMSTLDRVVVSHADGDHAGGLDAILAAFPGALYQSSDLSLFPDSVRHEVCREGERWIWDGVEFEMLAPFGKLISRNDGSCVLRIKVGEQVALLTGDIERAREHGLLARGLSGPVTLLMAPHHGSATSSSPAFLDALRPEHVVFTTAYLNRYGHPAPSVVDRYTRMGTRQWYTMKSGALSFTLDGGDASPNPRQYRLERRRFWAAPLP